MILLGEYQSGPWDRPLGADSTYPTALSPTWRFRRQTLGSCSTRRALCGGVDGLRPRVGLSMNWKHERVSRAAPNGPRLVAGWSMYAQSGGIRQRHLDLAPREGPRQGGEILGFVLGSAGHQIRL
jgi:hypothetical protein